MSIEAHLYNAKLFVSIIDSFKALVNQGTFVFSKDGLKLEAMDAGRISLNTFFLKNNAFDFYNYEGEDETPIQIGIDLTNLAILLKFVEAGDTLALKYEEDSDSVTVIITNNPDLIGKKKKKISGKYQEAELNIVELDMDDLNIPTFDYDLKMSIESKKFKKMISGYKNIGDSINFKSDISEEDVTISVRGDIGNMKEIMSNDEEENPTIIFGEDEVNATFSMKYLENFSKASDLSNRVALEMSSGAPLEVRYEISQDEEEIGIIKYFLAPKCDEDDD